MKLTITTIICILTVNFTNAQSTTIQTDTTKANEYLEQAKNLEDGSTEKIDLIKKAATLCANYDIPKKIIAINSQLTYQYAETEAEKTIEIGQANIDFAKAKLQDDKLPELGLTYWGMQHYHFSFPEEDNNIKAKDYGEIAMQILPKGSKEYFEVVFKQFQIYILLEEFEKFENKLNQVKHIVEIEKNSTAINAKMTLYLGQFLYNFIFENNELIITYGQQSLLEIEKHQLDYNKDIIYTEISLAYGEIGQLKKGIEWANKLKKSEKDIEENLSYYEQLIQLYLAYELYDKAIMFFNKAIGIREKSDNEDNLLYLRSLYEEIAACYIKTKDYVQAETFIQKAYKYEQTYEPFIIEIYYAQLLNETQRFDKGLEHIQNAISKLVPNFNINTSPEAIDEYDLEWLAYTLRIKSKLLLNKAVQTNDKKLLSEAQVVINHSIDLYTQILYNTRGYETAKLYASSDINDGLKILQDIEYQIYQSTPTKPQLNKLFKVTERCKAINLLETLTPESLPKSVLEKEKVLVHKVKKLEQTILTQSNKDSIDDYQTALTQASYELEKFQNELIRQYPKQIATDYQYAYTNLQMIQENLPAKTIWIEYAYNENEMLLYIYSISQQEIKLNTIPIDATFFEDITRLQRLLKNRLLIQKTKQKDFITTSHRLYKKLILPIQAELEAVENLYIVPEQTMFNIPFEVLLPTADIQPYDKLDYLIRHYAIGYHYSATTFSALQSIKTVKDKSLLAFAPVFNNNQSLGNTNRSIAVLHDSLYRSIDDNRFVPLPNSKIEIQTISTIVNSTNIFIENQATKNNFTETIQKQSYQYIHLATHGLVNFENHQLSALAFFDDNYQHTLLFANEIVMQEINVDLVVLSSCESGIGKLIGGEGLIALNRSFIHAGAKNVLFSLWKVDDKYSSELMINFYENQTESITYIKALQLSKLQLLENPESALPRYWAAFVLIGE